MAKPPSVIAKTRTDVVGGRRPHVRQRRTPTTADLAGPLPPVVVVKVSGRASLTRVSGKGGLLRVPANRNPPTPPASRRLTTEETRIRPIGPTTRVPTSYAVLNTRLMAAQHATTPHLEKPTTTIGDDTRGPEGADQTRDRSVATAGTDKVPNTDSSLYYHVWSPITQKHALGLKLHGSRRLPQ